MEDYTNTEIIAILRTRQGGLRKFLTEIPKD
jgi:hypothetical protein